MPLSTHVAPPGPAPSARTLSPTVVATALKVARTSSVPAAATASVRVSMEVALGSMSEP